MIKKVILIFMMLIIMSGGVLAQNSNNQVFSDQVYSQLKDSYMTISKFGDVVLESVVITFSTNDEFDSWTKYMSSDRTYFIAGACDSDCTDIDLYLGLEGSSEILAEDNDMDDKPLITFNPPEDGYYIISTILYNCDQAICYQGFSVISMSNN